MKNFNHFSGKYLLVDDGNIYYEETGNADAPVLLLLHGGFGTLEDFNPIINGLEKEYRIIGMDSRGQGMSTTGSATLTYQRLQEDVEFLLAYLHVETLSIIGFSDGGIVAYRLAVLTAWKIDKLVTISSRWQLNDALLTKDLLKISPRSWRLKHPDMYDTYQKLNPKPDYDQLTKQLAAMWLDEKPSGYVNEAVQHIGCPLLVVRGDDDALTSRESMSAISALVKNATFFNVPFAQHVVFADQPEVFMRVLNQFLAKP